MVASGNRSRTLPQTAAARGVAESAATPFSIQPGASRSGFKALAKAGFSG